MAETTTLRRPTYLLPAVAQAPRSRTRWAVRLGAAWQAFLRKRARWLGIAGSFALVYVIGLLDFLTGPEVSLSILYLVPTGLATWYLGLPWGIALSGLGAVVWWVADTTAGMAWSHWAIPFWNSLVRVGMLSVLAVLLARLESAMNHLRARARIDGMTGGTQANVFWHLAEVERGRATRCRHAFALALADLHGLKDVNDRLGRPAGDELLRAVVAGMKEHLYETDTVSRLGGCRLGLLLPETGRLRVDQVFPKLRDRLCSLIQEHEWPVTFRLGVVTFLDPPASVGAMVAQVDALLVPGDDPKETLRKAVVRADAAPSIGCL